ncbi:unnamed protein product [Linum tenue]|uniref:Uncharacterized protein n=2 Tax=Linum tenue TaxID=586396 RepID=A0AAV0LJL6_9ROSI|nr:unnamed protein product [Linum tenue]
MAYVDHAFSITDDDLMMDGSYTNTNRPSIKEIGIAVSLLVFGVIGIVVGFFMTSKSWWRQSSWWFGFLPLGF